MNGTQATKVAVVNDSYLLVVTNCNIDTEDCKSTESSTNIQHYTP